MKFFISPALLMLLSFASFSQLQQFSLERNGVTIRIYKNLDTAVADAQNGDEIILPGGVINFSGTIRKGISLRGAGYNSATTKVTGPTIFNTLKVLRGADNFYMTGVYIQGEMQVDSCNNILLHRCRVGTAAQDVFTILNACSGILIKECVIATLQNSNHSATQIAVTNSIIYGQIATNAATFTNNIFTAANGCWVFNPPYCNAALFAWGGMSGGYVINCFFKNNIINNGAASWFAHYNTYENNVFTDDVTINAVTPSQSNNIKLQLNNIFNASITTTGFNATDDFHLKPGSGAIGAGVNGVDCGIYGGGGFSYIPAGPYMESAIIPSTTDQNGILKINVKVSAKK